MTNQAILTKAINQAIDGGWKHPNGWTYLPNWKGASIFMSVQFADDTGEVWHMPIESLIFSHQFAKALWGEDKLKLTPGQALFGKTYSVQFGGGVFRQTAWKYHLQRMVLAKDPLKYLGEHLEQD